MIETYKKLPFIADSYPYKDKWRDRWTIEAIEYFTAPLKDNEGIYLTDFPADLTEEKIIEELKSMIIMCFVLSKKIFCPKENYKEMLLLKTTSNKIIEEFLIQKTKEFYKENERND